MRGSVPPFVKTIFPLPGDSRLPRAMLAGPRQTSHGSRFRFKPAFLQGRYVIMSVPPLLWKGLERAGHVALSSARPAMLSNRELDVCLAEPVLRTEFETKASWRLAIFGVRGAGMYNHSDSLRTSSWHATRPATCGSQLHPTPPAMIREGDSITPHGDAAMGPPASS